jgi:D-serine deaminase-like pyridoxal phosphate-dependent protein
LRPHVKTHKTKEVAQLCMQEGITKFKCATIAEAEMLGMISAPDVLLAYQPVGPKLKRFITLSKEYPQTSFSCLVDNNNSVKEIAALGYENSIVIPVYIDINTGMNRTGILPGKEAIELYELCKRMKGIQPLGLHAYDGHLHQPDLSERTIESNKAFIPVKEMKEQLTWLDFGEVKIIAGGSPSFPIHAKNKEVECSPGTFVYWDAGYLDVCKEQSFIPAALVITRVISITAKNRITVDLGHKSVAAENALAQRVVFLNAPDAKPVSQSEEHLVLEVSHVGNYKIGSVLYGLPVHICPTCALYEQAYVIKNHRPAEEWKMISRDRKIIH